MTPEPSQSLTAEFNRTLYVTDALTLSTAKPLNEFTDPKKQVDNQAAQAELENIIAGYQAVGASVIRFTDFPHTPGGGYQDIIYTANHAFILNGKALVANLPYERQAEEPLAERWLSTLGLETVRMPRELGLFSGKGDALYIPGTTYVIAGSGYRNDLRAHAFLEQAFGVKVLPIKTIPRRTLLGWKNDVAGKPYKTTERDGSTLYHSPAYDCDIAFGILRGQTAEHKALVAYAPSLLTRESRAFMQQQDLFDTLEVNRHDAYAFGCNLLSTGTGFVVHDTAKQFIRDARKLGLSPYPVSNIEIAKGGGGVHCIENALDNTTPDYLAAHGPVTLKTT